MIEKLIPYNDDTEIYEAELKVLQEIQQITKKKFWLVENIQKAYEMDTSNYFSVQDHHIVELDIHNAGLIKLPTSIKNLIYLKSLDLRNNKLEGLPASLSGLNKLEYLNIGDNNFEEIPDSIYNLHSLKELKANFNVIKVISEDISNLQNLEILDLQRNHLSSLPNAICRLKRLKSLNLDRNYLKLLPENLGDLIALESLILGSSYMRIPVNFLEELPKSIGNLNLLKFLNISGNPINKLPDTIKNLSNLEDLNLSKLGLDKFPTQICELKSLKYLSIGNNNISYIPDDIEKLSSLEGLRIGKNPLTTLPRAIVRLPRLISLGVHNLEQAIIEDLFRKANINNYRIEDGFVKFYPQELLELDKIQPEIIFRSTELDYRIILLMKHLIELRDLFEDSIDSELTEFLERRKDSLIYTISEITTVLEGSGQLPQSLIDFSKLKNVDDIHNLFSKLEKAWNIKLNSDRKKHLDLMEGYDMIWEIKKYEIIFPYKEIRIIPNTEITLFQGFPQGALNTPIPEHMFQINDPKVLIIRREPGIRAIDLKNAFEEKLLIYGDFHFFEIMNYLWDYKNIPVYFLFIGS